MQNSRFPLEWIETLKQKNDIVQTISKYVPIIKKGNSLWARCPFHHEKTPSFAINEMEQYYHCFGCGVGGDVIKFVSEIESCTRIEAIKILAESAQMELPNIENSDKIIERKKEKDKLISALNEAKDYYVKCLYKPTSKIAQNYIKIRNLNKRDIERFQIGYSKDSYSLVNHLKEKGYDIETLKKAGIVSQNEGSPYDFLCDRLIFPIIDTYENCIGYSGRILTKDTERAKYKNTAQTMVFDKGSTVYGINLLKEYKRNNHLNTIIIVEGQMDVITMHHYGFENAVACMGTALTEKHGHELKRFCNNITLCFDGDSAGIKAGLRAIPILTQMDFNVNVVALPDGQDPDEYLKKYGAEKLRNLVDNPLSTTEFKLKVEKDKYDLTKTNERATYVKSALEIIRELKSSSEMDVYLNELKKETNVPIDVLRKDLQINTLGVKTDNDKNVVLISKEDGNIKAIKSILFYLIKNEDKVQKYKFVERYIDNPIYANIFKNAILKQEEELNEEEELALKDIEENEKIILDEQYIKDSIVKLRESQLKNKQQILSEQYKSCEDTDERKKIATELSKVINQLKIKNLEDFN